MRGMFVAVFLAMIGSRSVHAFAPQYGTTWMSQMRGYCPTCNLMMGPQMMPWGMPSPWWWQTGPINYSNFYSPAPWNYGYGYPGVMPQYYPGGGQIFAAKPNLYVEGDAGTKITVKVNFIEEGANWLASVPVHGTQGWSGTLIEKNKIRTDNGTYKYLYSDYRLYGRNFQDNEGFCAERSNLIPKLAIELKNSGFSGREIADFLDYWSVKIPQGDRFCVFPQDERQLNAVAPLDISPKPVSVRRVLFLVQPEGGLLKNGEKFTSAPTRSWNPQPLRAVAADSKSIRIREWGVGFLAAKPGKSN